MVLASPFPPGAQEVACGAGLAAGQTAGLAALERQDFGEAQRLLDRARQEAEPDSPCLGAILGGLGDALFGQGQYAAAVPLYRETLGLAKMALGADHLDVATALVSLGAAMFHATHDTAAEPVLARALAIRKRALGDHEDVAAVLDLIALVRFANAEAVSAEGLQGDAARMRARIAE